MYLNKLDAFENFNVRTVVILNIKFFQIHLWHKLFSEA